MRFPSGITRQIGSAVCLLAVLVCSALCHNAPPEPTKAKAHECCKRKAGQPGKPASHQEPETARCTPQPWDVRKEAPVVADATPAVAAVAAQAPRLDDAPVAAGRETAPSDALYLRNRVLRI